MKPSILNAIPSLPNKSTRAAERNAVSFRLLALAVSPFLLASIAAAAQHSTTDRHSAPATAEVLWYRTPAPIWDHALPVGNGRLGAMVFGGANTGANNGDLQDRRRNEPLMDGSQTSAGDEHLQLNESSIWQGGRVNRLNPCAPESVPKIRQLLLDSHWTDGAKISGAGLDSGTDPTESEPAGTGTGVTAETAGRGSEGALGRGLGADSPSSASWSSRTASEAASGQRRSRSGARACRIT